MVEAEPVETESTGGPVTECDLGVGCQLPALDGVPLILAPAINSLCILLDVSLTADPGCTYFQTGIFSYAKSANWPFPL